ncbi:MAG: GntR family transcriptional regulator [Bacteroidales bacterium]|nr:GntR family transcriptional regulator [Bacteroidales bacterium]
MIKFIRISENGSPKYQQIITGIFDAIESGELKKDDRIPSLKQLMNEFDISQDTVLKAYNQLKSMGVITSVVGKGYFIKREQTAQHHRVFLLFDNLAPYKEDLYQSIKEVFGEESSVDIFFHHDNETIYKKLINDALGKYTVYIIMPVEDPKMDEFLIKTLPERSVYIVDKGSKMLIENYPHVIQGYKHDVIENLSKAYERIKKYKRIRFIRRSARPHFLEIEDGIRSFAMKHNFPCEVIQSTTGIVIDQGDLFVVIEDRDLVLIIEQTKERAYKLGLEIGIISYNETQLKKVIANGITTVSTDFQLMGKTLAEMAMNKKRSSIYNKSNIIIRNSI